MLYKVISEQVVRHNIEPILKVLDDNYLISSVPRIDLCVGMNIQRREDIIKIVEYPLVDACLVLWDKGIRFDASCGCALSINRGAFIRLELASLSEKNKATAKIVCRGINKDELQIEVKRSSTVSEVSLGALKLANVFEDQN